MSISISNISSITSIMISIVMIILTGQILVSLLFPPLRTSGG